MIAFLLANCFTRMLQLVFKITNFAAYSWVPGEITLLQNTSSTHISSTGNPTKMEKRKFTWLIRNFDDIRDSKEVLQAQRFVFDVGSSIGLSGEWEAYLDIEKKGDREWLSVRVGPADLPEDVCYACGIFFRVDVEIYTKDGANLGNHDSFGRIFMGLGALSATAVYLWEPGDTISENMALTDDGSLPVHITVRVCNTSNKPVPSFQNYKGKFRKKLMDDLCSKVLEDTDILAEDCEVKVISRDGTIFTASRSVLCARSPVFHALFQPEGIVEDTEKDVIRITDVGDKGLDILLGFLSAGKLKSGWSDDAILEEVVYGANKYMLEDLVDCLDHKLAELATLRNCGKLYGMAKTYRMKRAEADLKIFLGRALQQRNAGREHVTQFVINAKMEIVQLLARNE